ncbi:MAG: phenylalanine--tRNA ligase subunit beta [Deltaproteobacteria bacterium]|nr:phenylalanine--tRNA ligase subunit beta [Deltaproteobacteria bacterium]
MKVSLSWLKDYISLEMEPSDLAEALTMAGLEVEAVSDRYSYLDTVLVGKIVKIAPHPNADKLKLCDVDVGNRMVSVVCGAPNIKKNMFVPAALPGTVYPDGSVLSETLIRGVTSEAMLCSEAELGLGTDSSGVMTVNSSGAIGEKIAKALNLSDTVIEIDLTPNRPDCLSILGIAREVNAIQKNGITFPDADLPDANGDILSLASVTIEAPDHCPRYAARVVEDITVAPSPFWLQDRLMSVGLRPINNIVDVTNFVMMETGQPLHAFDFDQLEENRIVVRTAQKGEIFVTLDKKERKLTQDMLMICDGKKPVAIGGVMGGLNSEISENTKRVLIESAYFNPVSIRKTAKKLGLGSDASHRFERGVDLDGTVNALNRAAQLIAKIGKGKLVEGVIDENPEQYQPKQILLSVKDTNRLLGTQLVSNEIEDLLTSIDFAVESDRAKGGDGHLMVVPPSFRVDVTRPEDLMEEVARLSGYNNIPTTFPNIPAERGRLSKTLDTREDIRLAMTGFGFAEAINYVFTDDSSCDRLGFDQNDPRRSLLYILNPLTEEQSVMRTSLLPGLLETARRNMAQQIKDLKLFEIGKVFIHSEKDRLPDEKEMLAGIWTGRRLDASWHSSEEGCDFYDIKGVAEELLNYLKISEVVFTRISGKSPTYIRKGYSADVLVDGTILGVVGELSPETLLSYGIKQASYFFELNLSQLMPIIPELKQVKPIPKYPAIARDITVIIDKKIESEKVLLHIKQFNEEFMERVYLFDIFEGGSISENKKSVSFRVIYRSLSETLEDDKINKIHQSIAGRLLDAFDAELPE